MDVIKVVNEYLHQESWKVKENSNSVYSYGGLAKHLVSEGFKEYWLKAVYEKGIKQAQDDNFIHIHDLGTLSVYCCGYSLRDVINQGITGVDNVPTSAPANHFDSILNQVANVITIFQNEIAGAVAFSSIDTLLAPFIKQDNLTYKQVKQHLQNFIFSINSNSRQGAEPAFTNLTLDLNPPSDLSEQYVNVGGEILNYQYKDCQAEMDMFNRAFAEIMLQGDSKGEPFPYPVPTYNITKDFNWDNPNTDLIFEMAGTYGYPYFTNFVNSDMDASDARSMCCRLRLDLTELRKRNGGLFGSGDSTGSIGVVTLNLPRMAYVSKDKDEFYSLLKKYIHVAKDSLEVKRTFLQKYVLDGGLIPAFSHYVGTLNNHFSTIGIIGMNEMVLNLLGVDILSREGKQFALEVSEFIRNELLLIQTETGHLYNYEATPAESTTYKFAKRDKKDFNDIITQGATAPYYTNSCHLPVDKVTGIFDTLEHQDELQTAFTGGTVVHLYINGRITKEQAKHIVKTAVYNYRLPYISISPLNRTCDNHGYIDTDGDTCPICGNKLNLYQKITGYIRKVSNYNKGKHAEFNDRNQYKTDI